MSEAELHYGLETMPEGRRRNALAVEVEGMLREDFIGRILPFDNEAARSYAKIVADCRTAGRPVSLADCQIAAIAHSVRIIPTWSSRCDRVPRRCGRFSAVPDTLREL